MATEKPRLSISMDEKTYEKVLEYKEQKGITTQSKAIVQLMEIGIAKMEKEIEKGKTSPYSEEVKKVAEDYSSLDHWGKRVVRSVIDNEKARCKEAADVEALAQKAAQITREQGLSEKEPDTPASFVKESGVV